MRIFLAGALGIRLIAAWFLVGVLLFRYAGGLRFRDTLLEHGVPGEESRNGLGSVFVLGVVCTVRDCDLDLLSAGTATLQSTGGLPDTGERNPRARNRGGLIRTWGRASSNI